MLIGVESMLVGEEKDEFEANRSVAHQTGCNRRLADLQAKTNYLGGTERVKCDKRASNTT